MRRECRPTLLIFADDWGRHPSSCQYIAENLLDCHYEVHWVNTIGMRPPRVDYATIVRGFEKIRHWALPHRVDHQLRSNLHVYNPRMWPWFRSRLDQRINRALLLGQLRPLVRSFRDPVVAITTIPIVSELVGRLPVRRWVYYCVDDFSEWPGLDQSTLRKMELDLVQHVDQLIAVSEVLKDRIQQMGRSAHLLTHGVDLRHWSQESLADESCSAISGILNLPKPLIVFWGVIDRRIDVSMIDRLSQDLTEGTIVLVGPESDPDPILLGLPRVVRVPAQPYEFLPQIAHASSVLIMPYADLPVTRAIQPLKLKEYLATGLPTVVSSLPATRPWADCLDLAATPEDFSRCVRSRIQTGLPNSQRNARRRLEREGWPEKTQKFERWILGPTSSQGMRDDAGDPLQPGQLEIL